METPILYEVNIDIEKDLAQEYEAWLEPHSKEVLATGAFAKAVLFRREATDAHYTGFTIHYYAKDESALDEYLYLHAPRLRKEAEAKFSGRFTVSRRILRSYSAALADFS